MIRRLVRQQQQLVQSALSVSVPIWYTLVTVGVVIWTLRLLGMDSETFIVFTSILMTVVLTIWPLVHRRIEMEIREVELRSDARPAREGKVPTPADGVVASRRASGEALKNIGTGHGTTGHLH